MQDIGEDTTRLDFAGLANGLVREKNPLCYLHDPKHDRIYFPFGKLHEFVGSIVKMVFSVRVRSSHTFGRLLCTFTLPLTGQCPFAGRHIPPGHHLLALVPRGGVRARRGAHTLLLTPTCFRVLVVWLTCRSCLQTEDSRSKGQSYGVPVASPVKKVKRAALFGDSDEDEPEPAENSFTKKLRSSKSHAQASLTAARRASCYNIQGQGQGARADAGRERPGWPSHAVDALQVP